MKEVVFVFKGESLYSQSLALSSIALFLTYGISLTLKLNPLGIGIALVIFILTYFIIKLKFIKKTTFYKNEIVSSYFLGNEVVIQYNEISRIYKNQEGFLPTHVNVIRYVRNGKEKKVTFYCSDIEFANVLSFLKTKELKIKTSREW
ncbi:MAG: hypothetical protein V4622_03655 [Bacteroidota bacterium]